MLSSTSLPALMVTGNIMHHALPIYWTACSVLSGATWLLAQLEQTTGENKSRAISFLAGDARHLLQIFRYMVLYQYFTTLGAIQQSWESVREMTEQPTEPNQRVNPQVADTE